MSILENTPAFSETQAVEIAEVLFGVKTTFIKNLPSERDQNFLLKADDGLRVLKVSNRSESPEALAAQNEMMIRLSGDSSASYAPKVFLDRDQQSIAKYSHGGLEWSVRLVEFLEGTPMADCSYLPASFFEQFGEVVGKVTGALDGFDHEGLHYDFQWDLKSALSVVNEHQSKVRCDQTKKSIQSISSRFAHHTVSKLADLPSSVLHNDLNDGNVVVQKKIEGFSDEFSVSGVIDFGDAIYGWTIGELAIAIAYAILEQPDPLEVLENMVKGYCKSRSLLAVEAECLFPLIGMRLCQSAALAAKQSAESPDNEYLNVSQNGIQRVLPLLASIPFEIAEYVVRDAAGHSQTEKRAHIEDWLRKNSADSADPIKLPGGLDVLQNSVPLDLSVESLLVPADIENYSISQLDSRIHDFLEGKVGIGGYLEPRLVYQGDHYQLGMAGQSLAFPRTVHLGVDYFCKEGTEVCSVLDGEIVSIERIERDKDYGNLVVIEHQTGEGHSFYTLYGHLSGAVHSKWKVGQKVGKGVAFAKVGAPDENGGWPPHLHFQLLTNFQSGQNPPGVCSSRWIEAWREFNLDPNLVFGYPDEAFPPKKQGFDESLCQRKRRMGGSLSLGYDRPLKMVRGWKHYLFDHSGRKYLDAFNNVPHVGHANPNVVKKLSQQASLLNTNTRYLNDATLDYAKRLTDTMPDPLEVCFFVNSASEANELALRMTRAVTGSKHMIVLEAGYHGNTTSLIDISPYKHEGPGGEGAPDWVHKAEIADCYRGPFRDPATAGLKYAQNVQEVIEKIQHGGNGLGGYIAESCPSVGGQILFPDGYLKHTYEFVRAAGGVCIADEVQTGFGRLGTHFYGFQMQEVVPDIVILGKPIGNGHPLAALVTTKEIADAFNNGMEYFSTFGGNMVSCTVGKAVLEEIEENGLQDNAQNVGGYLLDSLVPLKDEFDFVGDVRGSGFFLGVELVRDRETLEPADKEASFVSNRMKDRGVLLGTDGPFHNVIKIRPPMTFQKKDADRLVASLRECFKELSAVIG